MASLVGRGESADRPACPKPCNTPSSAMPERLSSFASARMTPKRLAGELGMSNPATLTQTNNYQAWIKLMRNGAPLEPRLIGTLAPPPPGARLAKVIAFAHARHMMPRKPVEERIAASFPNAPARRPRHKKRRDADTG